MQIPSIDRAELSAWLRLQLTAGVGNIGARKLLAAFGLPQNIFAQSLTALEQVVSHAQAKALRSEPASLQTQLATTLDWLAANPNAHRVVPLGDPAYPQTLLTIEDPPVLLYGMGMAQAWESPSLIALDNACIAIVGSRNPTPQGAANAHQFAHSLAQAGLTVVSGLALGVDGAAHQGAIEGSAASQLATVAVVGTGLDRVYPKQHRALAHQIAERGLVLSEFALGTPPMGDNFPKRNRIIAGLARGTLVVEAALKSGSLITARLAAEQGREVFAIPGSIHATQSHGCHALIKQGAKLVESAEDILEELKLASAAPSQPTWAAQELPETDLLQCLGFDPTGLDALQARSGLDTPTLQAQLMALELDGRVHRLPGGLFQRVVVG